MLLPWHLNVDVDSQSLPPSQRHSLSLWGCSQLINFSVLPAACFGVCRLQLLRWRLVGEKTQHQWCSAACLMNTCTQLTRAALAQWCGGGEVNLFCSSLLCGITFYTTSQLNWQVITTKFYLKTHLHTFAFISNWHIGCSLVLIINWNILLIHDFCSFSCFFCC